MGDMGIDRAVLEELFAFHGNDELGAGQKAALIFQKYTQQQKLLARESQVLTAYEGILFLKIQREFTPLQERRHPASFLNKLIQAQTQLTQAEGFPNVIIRTRAQTGEGCVF